MTHSTSTRLQLFDYGKGVAILLMIGVHTVYILAMAGLLPVELVNSLGNILVSRAIVITFIVCSTIILWYRSSETASTSAWRSTLLRQVVKLALAAGVVTFATSIVFPGSGVVFGILHLLTLATLINGVLFRLRIPPLWYGLLGVLVLILGNWLLSLTFTSTGWEWLGFTSSHFASIDYVPLLPWLGVTWLAVPAAPRLIQLARQLQEDHTQNTRWEWIAWCGRHSLTLYLLHAPIIFGSVWLFQHFL